MIDAHLASCAGCRWFADEAAHVTRLARTTVVVREPDVLDATVTVTSAMVTSATVTFTAVTSAAVIVSSDRLTAVLRALSDLDSASTTCAAAMMAHNTPDMLSATRAALDCADIAAAAQRVLSRPIATDASVIRAILEAAATAADRSAAECGQHAGHHGHCRIHSQSAQRTAELCRSELANIAG